MPVDKTAGDWTLVKLTEPYCVQGRRREGSETAVFYVSFISGFAAGSIGAFCVTPLDGALNISSVRDVIVSC